MRNSRCIFCMHETNGSSEVCPACKKGIWEYRWKENYLEPYTRLREKYMVGAALKETDSVIRYLGYDLVLEQKVLIYAWRQDIWEREKEREAAGLFGRFSLPGLTAVKDYFTEAEKGYMVTAFPEGTNLEAYEKAHGKIPEEEAVRLLMPVVHAASALHAAGIVHGNIKPEQLILTEDQTLCLLAETGGHVPGEAADSYAAPEQGEEDGILGPWTDIYAVCAVWYEMVTGHKPETALKRRKKDMLKPLSRYAEIERRTEKAWLQGVSLDSQTRFFYMGNLLESMNVPKEAEDRQAGAIREKWADAWLEAAQRTQVQGKKKNAGKYLLKRLLTAGIALACLASAAAGGVYAYIQIHQPEYFAWKLEQAKKETDTQPYKGVFTKEDDGYEEVKEFILKYGETDEEDKNAERTNLYYEIKEADWQYCPGSQSAKESFCLDYTTAKKAVEYYMETEGRMDLFEEGDYLTACIDNDEEAAIALFADKEETYRVRGEDEQVKYTYDVLSDRLLKMEYTGEKERCAYFLETLLPLLMTETYLTKEECSELMQTELAEGEWVRLRPHPKYEIAISHKDDYQDGDSMLYTASIEPNRSSYREWYGVYMEEPEKDTTSYAGNYEKGSRRYKEFLSYVKENAVSEETLKADSQLIDQEGAVLYTLEKPDVLEWGEPCNAFRFFVQTDDVIAGLKKQGYQMEKQSEKEKITVEVQKYGAILTHFSVIERYRMTDDIYIAIARDVVSEEVLQMLVYKKEGTNADISQATADAGALVGACEKEEIKELSNKIREQQKEAEEEQGTIHLMTNETEFMSRWKEHTGVETHIVPIGLFDGKPYYWP